MNHYTRFCLCLVAAASLSGCMGAVTGGTNMVYNRYTVDKSVGNNVSAFKAQHLISNDPAFKNSHVAVNTEGSEVLLTGQVQSTHLKAKAAALMHDQLDPKPSHVYNYLTIGNPTSTSTSLDDSWITTKIRSDIVANGTIDPHAVKVVTENGKVYLMGTLIQSQAQSMVKIARGADGVTGVVSLLHILVIKQ